MVWCVGPSTLPCLATSRLLPPHPPRTTSFPTPPTPNCHHLFSTFLPPLSIFLCLSTHLSSQRILHWSNECANSACCIKCGHPYKLHPLQGIGVIGSEAVLQSPLRALSRFTFSCQSPKPITTPEVVVLISPAVSLQQQTQQFAFKQTLYETFDEIRCNLLRYRALYHKCIAERLEEATSWNVYHTSITFFCSQAHFLMEQIFNYGKVKL